MPVLIVFAFIGLFVLIAVFGWMQAEQRRKALAAWAQGRGLSFRPDKEWGWDSAYPAFGCLARGSNRYAYNIMVGTWSGRSIRAFDYHYETHSTDSKGHRQTHHHRFSAVILSSPVPLKPLVIRPEGFFDRVSEFFGAGDINFESAEFSRRFHVSSPDRRWAYDLLHPRTIEFLLTAPVFAMEFDPAQVIASRGKVFEPAEFEQAAQVISTVLDGMPGYLVQQQRGLDASPEPPPLPSQPPPLPPPFPSPGPPPLPGAPPA